MTPRRCAAMARSRGLGHTTCSGSSLVGLGYLTHYDAFSAAAPRVAVANATSAGRTSDAAANEDALEASLGNWPTRPALAPPSARWLADLIERRAVHRLRRLPASACACRDAPTTEAGCRTARTHARGAAELLSGVASY